MGNALTYLYTNSDIQRDFGNGNFDRFQKGQCFFFFFLTVRGQTSIINRFTGFLSLEAKLTNEPLTKFDPRIVLSTSAKFLSVKRLHV